MLLVCRHIFWASTVPLPILWFLSEDFLWQLSCLGSKCQGINTLWMQPSDTDECGWEPPLLKLDNSDGFLYCLPGGPHCNQAPVARGGNLNNNVPFINLILFFPTRISLNHLSNYPLAFKFLSGGCLSIEHQTRKHFFQTMK